MSKLGFYPLLLGLFSLMVCGCNASQDFTKNKDQWSSGQKDMILEGSSDQPMRVFKITEPSDSILLRKKSMDVIPDTNDIVLQTFIDRLYSTVRDSMSLGVGIAAPQVGILKNIIWVQRFDKEGFPFEVYLNPRILKYSELKRPCLEGCLSIPEKRDTTQNRSYAILIDYLDRQGHPQVDMVEDFTAVIFQHEIDHLNGILFTDHLESDKKMEKSGND